MSRCLIGVGVPLIASLLPSVHMVRTQIIDQIRMAPDAGGLGSPFLLPLPLDAIVHP